MALICAMAGQVNWTEILEICYPSFTAEVNAFLESFQVSASPEIAAQIISDSIKADPKVWDNLKLLYHEAAYGNDKKVKKWIFNHITHFQRTWWWAWLLFILCKIYLKWNFFACHVQLILHY